MLANDSTINTAHRLEKWRAWQIYYSGNKRCKNRQTADMRRLITILALCFLVTTATAEEVKEVEKFKNMPVSTEAGGRFEFIQAPSNYGVVFLLDKYTGRVWGDNRFLKIKLEEIDVEERVEPSDTTRVNYQLYIHGNNYSVCFLLNVHTGELWKLAKRGGKSRFERV